MMPIYLLLAFDALLAIVTGILVFHKLAQRGKLVRLIASTVAVPVVFAFVATITIFLVWP